MFDDEYFMKIALDEASKALEENEVPVGAVLVIDNKIVASSHNQKEKKIDVTSHAEIEVIKQAAKETGSYILDKATLYVTLEPCLMCAGAIKDSRIKRIVFGALDTEKGAIISNFHVFDDPKVGYFPLITQGILKEECSSILKDFFKKLR